MKSEKVFTVTSFSATPTNNLSVPRHSIRVYHCNKCDMRNLREQNCFCTNTFYFNYIAQTFSRGNSRHCFPKWQICHSHRAFRLPLRTFRGKLRTFPTVKSKTIGFLLHRTQIYTPVLFWRISHDFCKKSSHAVIMRLVQEHQALAALHGACDSTRKLMEALCRTYFRAT